MERPHPQHARRPLLLILGFLCVMLLLSCAVGIVGVRQRRITVPTFWLQVGPLAVESCVPGWEDVTPGGYLDDTGRLQPPSAVWLMLYPPLGQGYSYQLLSIPSP